MIEWYPIRSALERKSLLPDKTWNQTFLLGFVLCCCAESALPPPVLDRLDPSVGYGKIEEDVIIHGARFSTAARRDLSGAKEFVLVAAFYARLRAEDGTARELREVAASDEQTLSSKIPAGLAVGRYALEVTGPAGEAAPLPDAYQVLPPLTVLDPAQTPDLGLSWVSLPGSNFLMGADSMFSPIDEFPIHLVIMPAFQILRTEVTVGQYRVCLQQGPCTAPGPGTECNQGYPDRESHPINCVGWEQGDAFCRWVGGRLPAEAEWEYASRGGGLDITYSWGDATPSCERAVHFTGTAGCGENHSWPVCSKATGNTAQELCDMGGNVWEWVLDWYHDSYSGAPADGSAWLVPDTGKRLYRGGSWGSSAEYLRASYRGIGPDIPTDQDGFRCAMAP